MVAKIKCLLYNQLSSSEPSLITYHAYDFSLVRLAGSYGSTLRYKSVERIKAIGKHTLLGATGEISDFQEILHYLDELM